MGAAPPPQPPPYTAPHAQPYSQPYSQPQPQPGPQPPRGYDMPPGYSPDAGRPPGPPKHDSNMLVLVVGIAVIVLLGVGAIVVVSITRSSAASSTATASDDLGALPTSSSTTTTLEEWAPFTPTGGGFSIELPGTPRESSNTANTRAGSLTEHSYETVSSDRTIGVTYFDLPPGTILDMREGARLITDQYGTSPTDLKDVNYAGNPALDFTIQRTNNQNEQARVRMIRIGDRFYVMLTIRDAKKAKENEADFDRLTNSLKIG